MILDRDIKDKILSANPLSLKQLVDYIDREKLFISDYSSLKKYVNEKNIDPLFYHSNEINTSDIQKEYSDIMYRVSNIKLENSNNLSLQYIMLQYIMNSESYTLEKMRNIEEYIANALNNTNMNIELVDILNGQVIPYKLTTLAIYKSFAPTIELG